MTDDVENFKEHYWRRVDAEFAARDARADQFEEAVEGTLDCYKDVPLDLQGAVLVSIAKGLVEADPDAKGELHGMLAETLAETDPVFAEVLAEVLERTPTER